MVMTPWGEPVTGRTINATSSGGPFTYSIGGIPDYKQMSVAVSFSGASSPPGAKLTGTSKAVDVIANKTATVNIVLQK
jgi:hypothetical protein